MRNVLPVKVFKWAMENWLENGKRKEWKPTCSYSSQSYSRSITVLCEKFKLQIWRLYFLLPCPSAKRGRTSRVAIVTSWSWWTVVLLKLVYHGSSVSAGNTFTSFFESSLDFWNMEWVWAKAVQNVESVIGFYRKYNTVSKLSNIHCKDINVLYCLL